MAIIGPPDEDPGWGPAVRAAARQVPPFMLLRRRTDDVDGLVLTRTVMLSFLNALVMIALVVAFLDAGQEPPKDPMSTSVAFAILAAATVVSLTAARLICRALPLSRAGDDPVALAGGYRTRMFLRIAFGESVGLLGFTLFFLTGEPTIAWVGLAISFVELAVNVSPTRRNLQREEEQLRADGIGRSLVASLRSTSMQNRR